MVISQADLENLKRVGGFPNKEVVRRETEKYSVEEYKQAFPSLNEYEIARVQEGQTWRLPEKTISQIQEHYSDLPEDVQRQAQVMGATSPSGQRFDTMQAVARGKAEGRVPASLTEGTPEQRQAFAQRLYEKNPDLFFESGGKVVETPRQVAYAPGSAATTIEVEGQKYSVAPERREEFVKSFERRTEAKPVNVELKVGDKWVDKAGNVHERIREEKGVPVPVVVPSKEVVSGWKSIIGIPGEDYWKFPTPLEKAVKGGVTAKPGMAYFGKEEKQEFLPFVLPQKGMPSQAELVKREAGFYDFKPIPKKEKAFVSKQPILTVDYLAEGSKAFERLQKNIIFEKPEMLDFEKSPESFSMIESEPKLIGERVEGDITHQDFEQTQTYKLKPELEKAYFEYERDVGLVEKGEKAFSDVEKSFFPEGFPKGTKFPSFIKAVELPERPKQFEGFFLFGQQLSGRPIKKEEIKKELMSGLGATFTGSEVEYVVNPNTGKKEYLTQLDFGSAKSVTEGDIQLITGGAVVVKSLGLIKGLGVTAGAVGGSEVAVDIVEASNFSLQVPIGLSPQYIESRKYSELTPISFKESVGFVDVGKEGTVIAASVAGGLIGGGLSYKGLSSIENLFPKTAKVTLTAAFPSEIKQAGIMSGETIQLGEVEYKTIFQKQKFPVVVKGSYQQGLELDFPSGTAGVKLKELEDVLKKSSFVIDESGLPAIGQVGRSSFNISFAEKTPIKVSSIEVTTPRKTSVLEEKDIVLGKRYGDLSKTATIWDVGLEPERIPVVKEEVKSEISALKTMFLAESDDVLRTELLGKIKGLEASIDEDLFLGRLSENRAAVGREIAKSQEVLSFSSKGKTSGAYFVGELGSKAEKFYASGETGFFLRQETGEFGTGKLYSIVGGQKDIFTLQEVKRPLPSKLAGFFGEQKAKVSSGLEKIRFEFGSSGVRAEIFEKNVEKVLGESVAKGFGGKLRTLYSRPKYLIEGLEKEKGVPINLDLIGGIRVKTAADVLREKELSNKISEAFKNLSKSNVKASKFESISPKTKLVKTKGIRFEIETTIVGAGEELPVRELPKVWGKKSGFFDSEKTAILARRNLMQFQKQAEKSLGSGRATVVAFKEFVVLKEKIGQQRSVVSSFTQSLQQKRTRQKPVLIEDIEFEQVQQPMVSQKYFSKTYSKPVLRQENRLIERMTNRQIDRVINKQFEKQLPRTTERLVPKSIDKMIEREISKPITKPVTKSIERLVSKQVEKQVSKLVSRTVSKIIPRTTTKIISFMPEPKAKMITFKSLGFQAFVRKRGKFRKTGKIASFGKAFGYGTREVLGTAARTFKVEPTRFVIEEEGAPASRLPLDIFRQKKGLYIQRTGKTILSRKEYESIRHPKDIAFYPTKSKQRKGGFL